MTQQTRTPQRTSPADAPRTARRKPREPSWFERSSIGSTAILALLGIVATIGLWWLAVIVFDIRPVILPSPLDVVEAFGDRPDHMLEQTWHTLAATVLGFVAAVIGGLILAVAVSASSVVNRALMPQIVAINAIPKVAIVPMLVVWLGFGPSMRVVTAFLIAFFPIVVATIAGLTSVPADLGELSRSLSASRRHVFTKISFPWALPQVFVGIKLAITLAVIGTVVAEMRVPNAGLGAVIVTATATSNMARAFAAIIVLMVISVALFYLIVALERLVLPWARDTSARLT